MPRSKEFTPEDDSLLAELGVEKTPARKASRTPREQRIIAGFEEIQRFVTENGRMPQHGEERGIFERLYAERLNRIRQQEESRNLLDPLDHQGLLADSIEDVDAPIDQLDDDALLAELGVTESSSDIEQLRHVRTAAEKRAVEEIASRQTCSDFAKFQPLFEQVQKEIDAGSRETRPFELKAEIEPGRFFIVSGQKAYVAEKNDVFTNAQGRRDARLLVIFDNGTESNMLMRSLQRALHKDKTSRRIMEAADGPLFEGSAEKGDVATGTIYVLRSKSEEPYIARNRKILHKIGVTDTSVRQRIAGARLQPTFLMADVEVVATYKLYNINRVKLEKLIHRVFVSARLKMEIPDRFGNPVAPREWFLVPLHVIDLAVEKIKDGTLVDYVYEPDKAALTPR
ncbi:MAG: GIY-YIG nuclease family protein [Gammaproteobacteria bacterium]|nr:GIY-YIG nuclease family protein [Gammaproteobacteria bacterium]MYD02371.1 GIY-YIG nuclease family protein [Gammaproteobacteria bacterium]MYI24835.1 GIY-YIG nuclease family protein [Gammaproteobacteria bacterium]